MAQDCSEWGEPVNDADEICIVPSEIFDTTDALPETETTDSIERNEPERSSMPLDQTSVATEPFMAQMSSEQTAHEQTPIDQNTHQASFPVFEPDQQTAMTTEQQPSLPDAMGVPFEVLSQPAIEPTFNVEQETNNGLEENVDLPIDAEPSQNISIPDVTPEPEILHEPEVTPEIEELNLATVETAQIQETINTVPLPSDLIEEEPTIKQDDQDNVVNENPAPTIEILSESQLDDELSKLRETIQLLNRKKKSSPEKAAEKIHDSAQDNGHQDQLESHSAAN